MKTAAAAKKLVCMPGHNYIYEGGMIRTRELVEGGDLGRIVSAYVMYNIHHPEEVAKRYPGVVRQILTHHSYILLYLVGKPVELCAMKADAPLPGVPGGGHCDGADAAGQRCPRPLLRQLRGRRPRGRPVDGDGQGDRHGRQHPYSYRDHVEIKPGLVHSQTYTAYQGSITNEVRHFLVDCLRLGAQPLSTLDDAITAQTMIEAAEESIPPRGRCEDVIIRPADDADLRAQIENRSEDNLVLSGFICVEICVISGPFYGGAQMEYRPLGKTGLSVSAMAQGGAAFGQQFGPVSAAQVAECVHAAIDAG